MKTLVPFGLVLLCSIGCDDAPAGETAQPDPMPLDASVDQGALDAARPDAAPVDVGIPDAAPDAAPPTLPPLPAIIGPAAAEDEDPDPTVTAFTLRASRMQLPLTNDLQIHGYGYGDQFPGPLLQARVGDEVVVEFINDLREPTTVHWHGLRIPDDMDGSPRVQAPVQPGESFTYRFVVPDAGTFWYHPHVRSNEQVEKGLYGMFIVHEAELPTFDAERAFVLDDLLLIDDQIPPFLQTHPEQMHGRNGNILLTNGRVELPTVNVDEGHTERWRLVNVANARTMNISLTGASFRVIGTDGGLLETPYEIERLQIAVGQRYDLEVRYDRPGTVELLTHVRVVDNGAVVERPFVLQTVEVAATGVQPRMVGLPTVDRPARGRPDRNANFSFDTIPDARTGQRWRINGHDMPEDPIFTFQKGEYVRMTLENEAAQEHPFHLHGQFFEILPGGTPETDQPGLKDTVLVPGNSRVTIFSRLDNPGRWMAHCHILEHAELGMMVEIEVLDE